LEGGGSNRAGILTNLNREIDEGDDYRDRTNELANIAEILEGNRWLLGAA
jgi:hypothetical protein